MKVTPDKRYPIYDVLDELHEKLAHNGIVILQAPPGAGKSTILPLELVGAPWLAEKKIIMLEPRRLAAKSVAERMSNLMGEDIGRSVGYRVRFDTRIGPDTRIEVVTEGILTRILQSDNSLEDTGLVIFDEFHERSIHADLALALVMQVQQVLRPDLRILIMSATLESSDLSARLGNVPVISSSGKQYPVVIHYASQESDQPITQRVVSMIKRGLNEQTGDLLVFLPGAGEITRTHRQLEDEGVGAVVLPLYGDLPYKKQQDAILPRKDGVRKVVLATSIAETSLTIEGITTVIDSGLSRVPRFDPRSGLTRLETIRVTRDAADQRAGRAGRLGPGVCYRSWTQGQQFHLQPQRKPEILEADLAPLLLELYQWGVKDVTDLLWVTTPPPGAVSQARELLFELEAIDESGITKRGKEILKLPTHPRIAHMLLVAREDEEKRKQSLDLAADIAAILEEKDPVDKAAGCDISFRIKALREWRRGEKVRADVQILERIERLASNWRNLLKVPVNNASPVEKEIGRLVWAAYPERVAQQQGRHSSRYKMSNGRIVNLPPHDPLIQEPWICAAQLDAGQGEGRIFLASYIDPDDLSDHTTQHEVVKWDEQRAMAISLKETRLGSLIISSRPGATMSDDKRVSILLQRVRDVGLDVIGNKESRVELQNRILSLHHWRPEEEWPAFTDNFLLNSLDRWLSPFLTNVTRESELRALDIHSMLVSALPWHLQQKLDELAPTRIQVPSGSWIRAQYKSDGAPPVVEVRLQEMFGLGETPTVNGGRTKVLLHLLSPGYKPVQVTQDLNSFWNTTYFEIKKELRIRYPRHHWPEDPWTAEAVRGAKRRNSS